MKANLSDHHLYDSSLLRFKSNDNEKDHDAISYESFNLEQHPNVRRLMPIRRSTNTVNQHSVSNGNGLIINGSLFDGQLFQPALSSYILDYRETPHDVNRFLEGHHTRSSGSHLDTHLFKLSFIITLFEDQNDREDLLEYCPRDYRDTHILEEISLYKRFCFPELDFKEGTKAKLIHDLSTYVFTRTNSNGQIEYGYCRRIFNDNRSMRKIPIIICIVSTYSYFKLYDAILNELTSAYISNAFECNMLMQSFYSKPIPVPTPNSSGITCILNDRRLFFYVCPTDERLNHDYFSTLLSCLSPTNITNIFDSMLRSKRILCFSNSLSKLTKCCLALSFLTYPFIWPYPFVALMPSSWLHDLLESPCPYIYGCLHENIQQLPPTIEKDTIFVDLDVNAVDICMDDGNFLPLDIRQILEGSLEYIKRFRLVKSNSNLINIAVSEACLRVFTELFHSLPNYFKRDSTSTESNPDEQKSLDHSKSLTHGDNRVDTQPVVSDQVDDESHDREYQEERFRLGYSFLSDEFLISQSKSSYIGFLNVFIRGMIFLKFLDDYQRIDSNSIQSFQLFTQRLNERRRMTTDELLINPVVRFRQTFDLLEKQMKTSSKSPNPLLSRIVKKLFE